MPGIHNVGGGFEQMHWVSEQEYESVRRLILLPLPPASLPSALCIYFLMIVFWRAVWRRACQWCVQEHIDRRGGGREREKTWKHQLQRSREGVHSTRLRAAAIGAIKVSGVFVDRRDLLLQIAGINWLCIPANTKNNVGVSPQRSPPNGKSSANWHEWWSVQPLVSDPGLSPAVRWEICMFNVIYTVLVQDVLTFEHNTCIACATKCKH